MTDIAVLEIAKRAMMVGIEVAGPLLIASLLVGTIVGILMAATQIQEFTLTFVPKIITMAIVLLVAGPWMLQTMKTFALMMLAKLPEMAP
ncbi:MAG: flagellar biosynthetic protein FliQ [bacterium]